jgi:hypothetical protein
VHDLIEFGTNLLLGATFVRHDVHMNTSKNPRFVPQSKHTVSVPNANLLILFMDVDNVNADDDKKHTNTQCRENPELLHAKARGTNSPPTYKRSIISYSYHHYTVCPGTRPERLPKQVPHILRSSPFSLNSSIFFFR